ncbi:MAG: cell division protein FtsQ/DivIB [Pseudanabaenaceae cyanobacterium]
MQDFQKRRRQIRYQQRLKVLKGIWQFVAVSGLTGAVLYWAGGQEWHIRSPQQISISGNRYIPADTLRSQLPLKYPQSIFQIAPQPLAEHLQKTAPVHQAIVERSVLPARLHITVYERQPVAISSRRGQVGFLDREGVWLPQTSYPPDIPKPSLTILEPSPDGIPYWQTLYVYIATSPVPIRQVDARNLQNLVLVTDLGLIHCGTYHPELFPQQLQAIVHLQALPKTIQNRPILYYDVRDPNSPIVQTSAPN